MPEFGRRVEFDERSRSFPIRSLVATATPRSYTWRCDLWLNQGPTSMCVGFSWAHELVSRPVVVPAGFPEAQSIYHAAQEVDEWPGSDYDGTSVLAGAKAVMAAGYLAEYRWAFGLSDLLLSLGHVGPAVLGVNWREGMLDTDPTGVIHATGPVVGGHAILATGVSYRLRRVKVHNSWGPRWGQGGDAYISFDDLASLLEDDGEACIPVHRLRGNL